MINIVQNIVNDIIIYPNLFIKKDEYRFSIYKNLPDDEKIGDFLSIDSTSCNFWTFQLQEVSINLEDLPNGLICLRDDSGFYNFKLQGKDFIETDWINLYEDLLFIEYVDTTIFI